MSTHPDRSQERGDASVEFIGILAVLVIPVLYIVLAVSMVSAGAMATEAGSREAARILARDIENEQEARTQIELIAEDFGVRDTPQLSIHCDGCESGRGLVTVNVRAHISLPFLPQWIERTGIDVSATASARQEEVQLSE